MILLEDVRKEYQKSLLKFTAVYERISRKGFLLIFKNLIELNNGVEKMRMVYIIPDEQQRKNGIEKSINTVKIKQSILRFFMDNLINDVKFWKFQNFNENNHLELLHWSEYLETNNLFYEDVFTTLQSEGVVINQEKVYYYPYSLI